jgi:ubiquinone/menaquinone biosynthesis C-methylase UbiE
LQHRHRRRQFRARAGADYTGIDLSSESLNLTRQRFDVYGLKGRFLQANAEEITKALPDEQFDLVYSFGVIHHTPDPSAVIAQARELIRPQGEFRLMLYARNSWKNVMIEAGSPARGAIRLSVAFTYRMRRACCGSGVVEIKQDLIFPGGAKHAWHEYEVELHSGDAG